MNSKNSKIFDPYRLLLNVTDKINLNKSDKHVALLNLQLRRGMNSLNYLIDHVLYQIFKNILNIFQKTWRKYF